MHVFKFGLLIGVSCLACQNSPRSFANEFFSLSYREQACFNSKEINELFKNDKEKFRAIFVHIKAEVLVEKELQKVKADEFIEIIKRHDLRMVELGMPHAYLNEDLGKKALFILGKQHALEMEDLRKKYALQIDALANVQSHLEILESFTYWGFHHPLTLKKEELDKRTVLIFRGSTQRERITFYKQKEYDQFIELRGPLFRIEVEERKKKVIYLLQELVHNQTYFADYSETVERRRKKALESEMRRIDLTRKAMEDRKRHEEADKKTILVLPQSSANPLEGQFHIFRNQRDYTDFKIEYGGPLLETSKGQTIIITSYKDLVHKAVYHVWSIDYFPKFQGREEQFLEVFSTPMSS